MRGSDPFRARIHFLIGGLMLLVGIGQVGCMEYLFNLDPYVEHSVLVWKLSDLIPEGTHLLVASIPGLILIMTGFMVIQKGRRFRISPPSLEDLVGRDDLILFLRPFSADNRPLPSDLLRFSKFAPRYWSMLKLFILGIQSTEQLLAYVLNRFGTLVTIGNPLEDLPLLGAGRIYVDDPGHSGRGTSDEWHRTVERLITHSRVIILQIGCTEALGWEISSVISHRRPETVILCLLPSAKERKWSWDRLDSHKQKEIERTWKVFRDAYLFQFPGGLPETVGRSRFIVFDPGWEPKRILLDCDTAPLGLKDDLESPDRDTLHGALKWLTWILLPPWKPRHEYEAK